MADFLCEYCRKKLAWVDDLNKAAITIKCPRCKIDNTLTPLKEKSTVELPECPEHLK